MIEQLFEQEPERIKEVVLIKLEKGDLRKPLTEDQYKFYKVLLYFKEGFYYDNVEFLFNLRFDVFLRKLDEFVEMNYIKYEIKKHKNKNKLIIKFLNKNGVELI